MVTPTRLFAIMVKGMINLSDFMNAPEQTHKSYLRYDKQGLKWVSCPYCGKKQFLVNDGTKIINLPWKCKGSNCKQEMIVNVWWQNAQSKRCGVATGMFSERYAVMSDRLRTVDEHGEKLQGLSLTSQNKIYASAKVPYLYASAKSSEMGVWLFLWQKKKLSVRRNGTDKRF